MTATTLTPAPARGCPAEQLAQALTAGPAPSAAQWAAWVRAMHRGEAVAGMLELRLVEPGQAQAAQAAVARGRRAQRRLLETLLPYVAAAVGAAQDPPHALPTDLVRHALATVLLTLRRLDPARPGGVLEQVRGDLAVALAHAPSEPGQAGQESGWLTLVRVRAELVGVELSGVETAVLGCRFGLGDGRPLSLAETGAALGLSRERVRQVESGVLAALRRHPSTARRRAG